jgi:crotonobetainyl-CoA:carnitine CoA-transferase CaiB-like acyl-CoA transferase
MERAMVTNEASVFDGLEVFELTSGVAGATAAMYLGDFGASVLKVVSADLVAGAPGQLCWDRNKKIVRLDVARNSDDRLRARRLAASADVVVTDVVPGSAERWGFDATTLMGLNPSLVHAWVPPHGLKGRWSQLPNDELLLDATSSVADAHAASEDVPVFPVTPAIPYGHGALAAAAIAAAVLERIDTGRGRALAVSGLHGLAAMNSALLNEAPGVTRMTVKGSKGGPNVRMYQGNDGRWFQLFCLTPKFFLKALAAIDMVEVMAMPGIEGNFLNLYHPEFGAAATARLEQRFAERPCAEWCSLLLDARVPVAPVADRADWLQSELVTASGMRAELEHPTLGTVSMPGVPITLHSTPGRVRSLPTQVDLEGSDAQLAVLPSADGGALAERQASPLSGLRVLDLSTFIAGPQCTAILADFGAEVIKLEPLDGDPYRLVSVAFVAVNQRKKGIALDIREPDGYAALVRLVQNVDVLVHNFPPGLDEELRVDYPTLQKQNPRLVHYSVSAYGRSGPFARVPGFDQLLQARGGLAAAQGGDGPPVGSVIPVHDVTAASIGAFGILAALHSRARTGVGQEVTTSLAAVATILQAGELTAYPGSPLPLRGGPDFPGPTALRRYYRCADGWVAVSAPTEEAARAVCEALECHQSEGAAISAAPPHGPLAEELAAALGGLTVETAVDRLSVRGLACAPVLSRFTATNDPWLWENGFFHEVEDEQLGTCRVVRTFAEWFAGGTRDARSAPVLGQDTGAVLGAAGLSTSELEGLYSRKVASSPT